MVRDFSTQKEVFEPITVAAVVLDDPHTAEREMERAFAALLRYKRPIYIEVPRDLVHVPLPPAPPARDAEPLASNPAALEEALAEITGLLTQAKRPVILAGAEIGRFGLQDELVRLVERLQIPIATTLLGKSVIREDHPLYVGVYGGLIGRDDVQEFVNESDCLLILGTLLTDIEDLTAQSPVLAAGRAIHATADRIAVKHHRYDDIGFVDFIKALVDLPVKPFAPRPLPSREVDATTPAPESPATIRGLFTHLNSRLDETMLVIADVGDALFGAVDLRVHRRFEFIAPGYYTSMGFAVPAAVGVSFAEPSVRPIVLVGDGAFQMTGTELSTCARYGLSPIVVILNNRGYSTERAILPGTFNDLHNWHYEKVCELLGTGVGIRVTTHGDFMAALDRALADRHTLYVLNVLLDPADRSPGMVRLARRLAKRLSGSG
jgi:indolepyruvate decarboxylase